MNRRLWRDLGFHEPQPAILPFLPCLVVAWADDRVGERECERIRSHASRLPPHLAEWLEKRLVNPPGPYFRYQVLHLLAFMVNTWKRELREGGDWAETGEEWAREILSAQPWMRRMFGGVEAEREELEALHDALQQHDMMATDRLWSLARGAHAGGEPRHVVVVHEDHDQYAYAMAVVLDGEDERIAVGTFGTLVRAEDLPEDELRAVLARTRHLFEHERWAAVSERMAARGRALTTHQLQALRDDLEAQLGCPFEEVDASELAYLEDALAADAQWMSWIPGQLEELCIDRERVLRASAPGTFDAPRDTVNATVAQSLVPGPRGMAYRILSLDTDAQHLRLACPVVTEEPPSDEAIALLARILPATCDPLQQLVLCPGTGEAHWVAEVHSALPEAPCRTREPLPEERALLVPPWVLLRAAAALGRGVFSARRRIRTDDGADAR